MKVLHASREWKLIVALSALHVILSLWQMYVAQINNDGILYVTAGRFFSEGRFAEGLAVYKWPGYSLVIGGVSALTGVDALWAVHGITIVASTITFLLVLRIAWFVLPQRAMLIAVAVLMFGNLGWNEGRGSVVREHLYILFVVLSFYFLLLDLHAPRLLYKLGFLAAGLAAFSFRVDALAFLILVPLFRALWEVKNRTLRVGVLVAIAALGLAAPLAIAYWSGGDIGHFFYIVQQRIETIRNQVLAPFQMRKAHLAYVSMIIGLFVTGLVASLGLANISLAAYGLYARPALRRSPLVYLFALYLIAGSAMLAVQVYLNLALDRRHGLMLSLLLTVPAAFGLLELYERYKTARSRFVSAFALFIAVCLVFGLVAGIKKHDVNSYVRTAAAWLSAHAPKTARILSNDNQILFYAGFANHDHNFLIQVDNAPRLAGLRKWSDYDFVVVRVRRSRLNLVPEMEKEIGRAPVKMLENSRGDRIMIFRPR
jgi:hypothetical protein